MRPLLGISLELLALGAIFGVGFVVTLGPLYLFYVVAAQLLATYLIHCPAHYVVGSVLGIRFKKIGPGRTTLARALPRRFRKIAGIIPILSLSTDKGSVSRVAKASASAMYLSGTVASCAAAFIVAVAVSLSGPWDVRVAAWSVAVGYLLFDAMFSPRSGDLMRARVARSSA